MFAATGVPLGVEEDLPLSPDVWPPTPRTTDPHDLLEPAPHDNYPSAQEHQLALRDTYLEDVKEGYALGPFTSDQAATICGCTPPELCHGALAGKPESDKVRTIHDATAANVNQHIAAHTHQRTQNPTHTDLSHAVSLINTPHLWLLKLDCRKAHRQIPVHPKDWRYITARLGDEIFINTSGTYGVSSAQYWWSRQAALLTRLCYHLHPSIRWAFVYVDDFLFVLHTHEPELTASTTILFFQLLNVPVSWHKTRLARATEWLGLTVNLHDMTLAPTEQAKVFLRQILHDLLTSSPRTLARWRKDIHRLLWHLSPFPTARAFMPPYSPCFTPPSPSPHPLAWHKRPP